MKKMFKVLAVVLCIAMAFSCLCLTGCKKKNDAYVIGLSGPLTGAASVYGTAVANSAQMAVDEINEAGGLNGVPFKLIAMDDKHDATMISTNYASLMEQGMQVSLGCVTTNPCLEFAKLSKEDNVFFLTPSASADAVPAADNAFQMCFADGNQGSVAADYVNSLGLDTIGIFYKNDDAYSNGIYKQFKDNLKDGIKTIEASFTEDTANDFSAQINELKDCTFIFMPIYYTPASLFMTQAKSTIAADAVYYGCDGFDGIESAEGFTISEIPQEIVMLSHFNSKATEGAAKDFIAKYSEKFGTETLNQFGASAYDCVYAIFNAMKAAIDGGTEIPVDISASDLCEILKKQFTGDFKYSGVTGTDIKWQANGFVDKSAVAFVIKESN